MIYSIWILIVSLSIVFCYRPTDYNITGTTAHGWEFVRDLFRDNFLQQQDLGAAIAVYHQGHSVVNLKGGWFDEAHTKSYDDDTLQLVFSTTKGVVAMAAAICVQWGLLDYSALVTKYWPEYGQNGKENTTVADILSHRAGLPYVSSPVEQYANWSLMIHILEEQEPLWIPGTTHGYHAVTYGWLVGELVRRVDPKRRSFGQFIKDEIATRTQIEFYIGLPPDIQYRVSSVVPHLNVKNTLNESMLTYFGIWNDPKIHQAEIPAAIGISNAWSIARLYAAFIGNIKDKSGQRLLNDEILKRAIKSNTPSNEIDLVLQYYSSFSMGFHRFDHALPAFGPDVFGHHGRTMITDQIINRFYFHIF
jgi:CubicO group peptidase (beta-lactamase class C family)